MKGKEIPSFTKQFVELRLDSRENESDDEINKTGNAFITVS